MTTTFEKGGKYSLIRNWIVIIDTPSNYVIHVVQLEPTVEAAAEEFAKHFPVIGDLVRIRAKEAYKVTINLNPVIRRFLDSIEIQP